MLDFRILRFVEFYYLSELKVARNISKRIRIVKNRMEIWIDSIGTQHRSPNRILKVSKLQNCTRCPFVSPTCQQISRHTVPSIRHRCRKNSPRSTFQSAHCRETGCLSARIPKRMIRRHCSYPIM